MDIEMRQINYPDVVLSGKIVSEETNYRKIHEVCIESPSLYRRSWRKVHETAQFCIRASFNLWFLMPIHVRASIHDMLLDFQSGNLLNK